MDTDRQARLRESIEENKKNRKAEKESAALDADLARIADITKVARGNWFALIAGLSFAGTTILSVKHIDFYDATKQTKLPILAIDVPISQFFFFSPIILLLLFGYFHIYLLKLWAALMRAQSEPYGTTLGEQVPPWLVSDLALFFRRRHRKHLEKEAIRRRRLDIPSAFLVFVFTWIFGVIVIGAFWYNALAANRHDLAILAATCLGTAIAVSWVSFYDLLIRSHNGAGFQSPWRAETVPGISIIVIATLTYADIRGILTPAGINLAGENIVERPEDWISYSEAKSQIQDKSLIQAQCSARKNCDSVSFQRELADRLQENRTRAYARLGPPRIPTSTDFARANMRQVFWPAANLRFGSLSGSDFSSAVLEGASLFGARMEGAILSEARMEGATLSEARMEGAILSEARMEGADLRRAQMEGANLSEARMDGAILSGAQMEGANLIGAQMDGANLRGAQMEGANLIGAQMEGADLSGAQMEGADLSLSLLTGSDTSTTLLLSTNLSASINNGGALRFVDLSAAIFDAKTDFRNAFMDETVQIPPSLTAQLGDQCQSILNRALPDDEFYGRWHGWLNMNPDPSPFFSWRFTAPEGFEDVDPIPPDDPNCVWKTEPMP